MAGKVAIGVLGFCVNSGEIGAGARYCKRSIPGIKFKRVSVANLMSKKLKPDLVPKICIIRSNLTEAKCRGLVDILLGLGVYVIAMSHMHGNKKNHEITQREERYTDFKFIDASSSGFMEELAETINWQVIQIHRISGN